LQQYSEAERAQLQQLYGELQGKYPSSPACKRIPLDFLTGEAFLAAVQQYVHRYLVKGIPSLFSDLKPLYQDAAKAAALGQLFERLRDSCQANGHLPEPPASSSGGADAAAAASSSSSSGADNHGGEEGRMNGTSAAAAASSSTGEDNPLTWVIYYLAQHHQQLGDIPGALAAIDAALQLAPEVPELYFSKSKILRGAGNAGAAAVCAEAARKLDLSDRYINSMAVKAMFKAGRVADGEALAALFTRDGADQVRVAEWVRRDGCVEWMRVGARIGWVTVY
jgi:peptide alpha-N-acetyltransferase